MIGLVPPWYGTIPNNGLDCPPLTHCHSLLVSLSHTHKQFCTIFGTTTIIIIIRMRFFFHLVVLATVPPTVVHGAGHTISPDVTLPLNAANVHWGYFSKDLTPVLNITSGTVVTVEMATHHACDDWVSVPLLYYYYYYYIIYILHSCCSRILWIFSPPNKN